MKGGIGDEGDVEGLAAFGVDVVCMELSDGAIGSNGYEEVEMGPFKEDRSSEGKAYFPAPGHGFEDAAHVFRRWNATLVGEWSVGVGHGRRAWLKPRVSGLLGWSAMTSKYSSVAFAGSEGIS